MNMNRNAWIAALSFGLVAAVATPSAGQPLTFQKVWTYGHSTPGQVSEIPAYDARTNTVWVAGVVGVDVIDAATGTLVDHIDVTSHGFINSVAIHNGLAAFAVEAPVDRRLPGKVLLYNTRSRTPVRGTSEIAVGPLPDMLTFTPDGRRLLVANEGTPNAVADTPYVAPDPPGSVSIIDVQARSVIATAGLSGVPQYGSHLRTNSGMDFEPEYIAVEPGGRRAFVTLQEGNAVGILDLAVNAFTAIVGLGAKDFSVPGSEIDTVDNDGQVLFQAVAAKGLYMPDSIASFRHRGETFVVTANEGDFREDNVDRSAGSTFGAAAPLNRLRVVNTESSAGNLYAAGARSFSIWTANGSLVFDSGNTLDVEAAARGIYDDVRSRDKGVEPEGVAVHSIRGRRYAFIGLERTLHSAVAVFDISNPYAVTFVDMIVTPGDRAPEGLKVFTHRGKHYLAIANETAATGATLTNTTLYRIGVPPRGNHDDDDDREESDDDRD
ncbi:MAG: choice-of-anchor I family protein [Vicinamibacterales bacterium]